MHWEASPKSVVLVQCQFSKTLQHKLKCFLFIALNKLFKSVNLKRQENLSIELLFRNMWKNILWVIVKGQRGKSTFVYLCFTKSLGSNNTNKEYSKRGEQKVLLQMTVSQNYQTFLFLSIFILFEIPISAFFHRLLCTCQRPALMRQRSRGLELGDL